jgi:hypothetical protein
LSGLISASKTHCWLTPRFLIDALGGWESFDLDPCAPAEQPWPTAKKTYTEHDNGLLLPWEGRVWLNPPYSIRLLTAFLDRMVGHGHGTALIFARTDTSAFFRHVWDQASAVLFIRGRVFFCDEAGNVAPNSGGAPSVLVAYGSKDADILAGVPIDGKFIPLRVPRNWLVALSDEPSWRELIARFFDGRQEPVRLEDLYRALSDHPKARRNQHYQEKIRQTLQKGRYVNVGRGVWQRREVANA